MAMIEVRSPLAASVVSLLVEVGQAVRAGAPVAIIESMKMEHEVRARDDGRVALLRVRAGDTVAEGEALVLLTPLATDASTDPSAHPSTDTAADPGALPSEPPATELSVRDDLRELREREAL